MFSTASGSLTTSRTNAESVESWEFNAKTCTSLSFSIRTISSRAPTLFRRKTENCFTQGPDVFSLICGSSVVAIQYAKILFVRVDQAKACWLRISGRDSHIIQSTRVRAKSRSGLVFRAIWLGGGGVARIVVDTGFEAGRRFRTSAGKPVGFTAVKVHLDGRRMVLRSLSIPDAIANLESVILKGARETQNIASHCYFIVRALRRNQRGRSQP